MKVVVVESREKEAAGSRLVMLVPDEDLWAVQVLCARAGQPILRVQEEERDAELVRS